MHLLWRVLRVHQNRKLQACPGADPVPPEASRVSARLAVKHAFKRDHRARASECHSDARVTIGILWELGAHVLAALPAIGAEVVAERFNRVVAGAFRPRWRGRG